MNEHFEIFTKFLINMSAKFYDFAGLIYYSQFWHATRCHVMFQLEYPQKNNFTILVFAERENLNIFAYAN